ncbi:hypothetical protein J6E39_09470 [bacterium]|nr:hypothetical protein [bacterium]
MGKAKKRSFKLGINDRLSNLTRKDALCEAVKLLNKLDSAAYNIITLFGLSAEELLEEGASYEAVRNIKNIL